MNTITLEWLEQNCACKEYLKFFKTNKLEGFPIDLLSGVEGDFDNFYNWINSQLETNYKLDKNGNTIKKIFENGRFYQCEYDERGNLTKEIYPSGYSTKYEYDKNDNLIKETYPSGCSTKYEYTNQGNTTKEIWSNGDVYQHEYEYDNLIKEIDPDGSVYRYVYEYYGNGQLRSIHENGRQILFIPKF